VWTAAIEIHANSCFLESLYRYSEFQTLCESTLTPSSKLHTVLRLMRCFLFSPTPFPFPSPPFRVSFLGSLALNSQGVWVSYSGRRGDRDIWAWRNAHSEAARQATLCENMLDKHDVFDDCCEWLKKPSPYPTLMLEKCTCKCCDAADNNTDGTWKRDGRVAVQSSRPV